MLTLNERRLNRKNLKRDLNPQLLHFDVCGLPLCYNHSHDVLVNLKILRIQNEAFALDNSVLGPNKTK